MTTAVPLPFVEGVTHRTVDLDGVRLHVAEAGSGPVVLLLHGWPQHWYAWRRVIPRLADGYRLVCPDLRGFGWSDAPPGRYDKRGLAGDVVALTDALELGPVHLLAHDWGAWIGFILCLEHPERFTDFVALNMYTPWPSAPSWRGLSVLARLWYQFLLAAPVLGELVIRRTPFVRALLTAGAAGAAGGGRAGGRPWSDDELEVFSAVLRAPERARASTHLYRTFLTRELPAFLEGEYAGRTLTVPTLLLHGTRDPAVDHRALGPWEDHARDMTVELRPDAGHFIAEEIPDVVADRARRFFAHSR